MKKIQGTGEYDIGYVTPWSFPNYGTALTQFSMYQILKEYGLSVLMIERPLSANSKPSSRPLMYRQYPYREEEMSPLLPNLKSMYSLNDKCKMFLLGSDQLFNNYLYNLFGRFVTLDWVRDNKRKVGFATSFGFDFIFGSEFDRAEMQRCLNKFDAVSTREMSGVELLQREFGIQGCFVLDPVFLCDINCFYGIAARSSYIVPDAPYYFAYILDPNEDKQLALEEIENTTHKHVIVISDAERTIEDTMTRWTFPTVSSKDIKVEEWLKLLIHSDGVITDSFHGTCFALVFEKVFITLANRIRGVTRFDTILTVSGQKERLLFEDGYGRASKLLQVDIDYHQINKIFEPYKQKSRKWLEDNLMGDYSKKGLSDYDKLNIRMDLLEDVLLARLSALSEMVAKNKSRSEKLLDRRSKNVHNPGKR